MAVNDYAGLTINNPQTAIQITKVTDSSADWGSVAVNTYFYDKGDNGIYYKNPSGNIVDVFNKHSLTNNEVFRGRTFRYDSTTVDTYGGIATLNNASALAIIPNTTLFGNRFVRLRYYASIVSTGRVTSVRSTDLQWYLSGGFRFVTTFRVADTVFGSTCQNFYGLIGSIAEIPVGTASLIQVSTLTNCIFVGSDGADTNLQVMHNDSSGTCTKIDLGANFPANRTAGSEMTTMYSIELYNPVATTSVTYKVINLETGAVSIGTITTNLPAVTQGLAIQAARVMGTATTNTGQFELHKWGCSDIII